VSADPPDDRPPLDAAALRRALVGDGLWTSLEVVAATGSTNADLVAAARAGAPEGRVLVAEHQSAGRGRSGRTWSSPPRAGLAVSVLLRPGGPAGPVPVARWTWLPLLAGVALRAAIRDVTGLAVHLKWPNDVLVGGRKCAGILAESTAEAVVLGMGVNVTLRPDELPPQVAGGLPATSLAVAGAGRTDREPLLSALLRELEHWYGRWRAAAGDAGSSGLRAAYLAASGTVGDRVRVLLPGGSELAGLAVTVDGDGRLVLRDEGGTSRVVAAGDIRHLRPA
jgi:BirA family transcriptional regulator, biotin operon repressor / biotin---[acetyl-CoA-carboxylase] ligase